MEWIRMHPYATTLASACLLLIVGSAIVQTHTPVDANNSSMTWGGGAPYISSGDAPSPSPSAIVSHIVQDQNPQKLTLPALATSSQYSTNAAGSTDSFDYAALLARISTAPVNIPMPATSSNALLTQAYQFMPQGFVATQGQTQKTLNAEQKVLYTYGNAAGSIIQTFETSHPNEAQILKDQAEDRTNSTKAVSVVALGKALVEVGAQLQVLSNVPSSVSTMHAALAQSYTDIGTKLEAVPSAQSDSDFVQAIKNYDATANIFVRNYATLAAYLTAAGVVFSPQDPGSVFSFSTATQ